MSSKTSAALASPIHPPVGTLIDGGSLELVEVLGVGGYGVVYRAIDTRHMSGPKSYAVKCLVTSGHQTLRQRQIHIREIALHQIASAHPGVVTLHRVVEQFNHTYIIMDYAPDHDLFTQILHSCRYLGDDGLIKDIFLQLLDAVEYCHALGIYHRDLKPENILCFDDGLRVSITDFGLATTDKESDEFRTGSVYHMSPECQGGDYAPNGTYSPKSNDIWSLGIILLNLATGRNPWKSATPNDPTFQAYLRDPMGFLPSVLPISDKVNKILVRMLEVNFLDRMTLREVRHAIQGVTTFYSDGVIFEGSMARCPWESGMDVDSSSSDTNPYTTPSHSPPVPSTYIESVDPHLVSRWSKDSTSDIVFAQYSAADSSYGALWTTYSSCGATWAFESPESSDSDNDPFRMDLFNRTETHSSSPSPESTLPTTPNALEMTYGSRIVKPDLRSGLFINTNIPRPRIYEANASMTSYSAGTSMMQTAIEYDPYSSMYFLNNHVSSSKGVVVIPDSAVTAVGEDKEMISPSVWMSSSATQMSSPSTNSDSSLSGSIDEDDFRFTRSTNPSPEPFDWSMFPTGPTQQVQCPPQQCQISSSVSTAITDVVPVLPPSRLSDSIFRPLKRKRRSSRITNTIKTVHNTTRNPNNNKPKSLSRFAIKFFPRSSSPTSSPPPAPPTSSISSSGLLTTELPRSSFTCFETSSPGIEQTTWASSLVATPEIHYQEQQQYRDHQESSTDAERCIPSHNNTPLHQQNQQSRSPRLNWFTPGRFRTSTGVVN